MNGTPDDFDDAETSLRPRAAAPPRPQGFALLVAEGSNQGQRFVVEQDATVLVGQSSACDVRLNDCEVSRRHARLAHAGDQLRVTDLGSTNGTFVDGVRVMDAFLLQGQCARLGGTVLRVEADDVPVRGTLSAADHFGKLLGVSAAMRRLYPLMERVASSLVPVLLEGETGTGKEVLAESIHEQGPRAGGPFVVFDCTAVAPTLVESELFGHERGAFTGATGQRSGLFEQAHGGTLLIDEIGDLDLGLQPKLLRALERGELRRVGGDRAIRFDVRVLSATRRDLDHEVTEGRFRDDLYHRLVVGRIELPPLRARRGDVAFLARAFCRQLGHPEDAVPAEVLARWEEAPWPGNVRELRNAVARRLALGELAPEARAPIHAAPGGDFLEGVLAQRLPLIEARRRIVDELERRYLERVLQEHGGNVVHAARAAGVARRYFQILKARRLS